MAKNSKKVLFKIRKKKKLEKSLEKLASEYATSLGMLVRKYQIPNRRFGLDRIFMLHNMVFFIEFKKPNKKRKKKLVADPGQERELSILLGFNIPGYVCDNLDHAKAIIDFEFEKMESIKRASNLIGALYTQDAD